MTEPRRRGFPRIPSSRVPAVTRSQMVWVDEQMTGRSGIGLARMMELAGLRLAEVVQGLEPRGVVVVAGGGNNGGGGLVCARHLANHGVLVEVLDGAFNARSGFAHEQEEILKGLGLRMDEAVDFTGADVVVDALIGYGLTGPVRGSSKSLMDAIGSSGSRVVSLDVPSGLDADRGVVGPHVTADITVTLALPKTGLLAAPSVTGRLLVADIGVPPRIYEGLGIPGYTFGSGGLIEVDLRK